MSSTPPIPTALRRRVAGRPTEGGPDGDSWLRALPGIVGARLRAWDLRVTGPPLTGQHALVLPVERDGAAAMLKVGWPHEESRTEHLALRHWDGRGAVRLLAAEPASGALLLEAVDPARDLRPVYIDRACEAVGELLGRLNVTAPPTIPRLGDVVGGWLAPLREHPATLPRRAVDRALDLFDQRPHGDLLLHADLHYENVLAAERAPWLAIDPKPLAGPRGFEVYPLLRNRTEEYGTGSTLRWQVRRRVLVAAEAAGIGWDEAREWSIVRAVLDAQYAAVHGDRGETTLHLAIAQALDD